ncbi:uncharacterized protein LOC123883983 [Trifolium pratense]|uniref:Uncharacterized protein n=1 Tax=Trifolium pratense TaxID=57577 RepID=A0ACB0L0Y5_TRIPR|nr:uncharacterized protein LOC123883983 [Trifolium pratense]CAJ2662333.1 unnamed protein product [Trifolium pratense]
MSVSGGAVIVGRRNTRHHVDNRFYCPPALRKQRQQQQEQQEQESTLIENNMPCSSSDNSVSSSSIDTTCDASNLCRFLEHTTPHVPAQYFPMKSKRRWRPMETELQPYFVLGDLWESFKEWSAYGAGVPLVLSGNESVTQYYNVSLSAIQLYIDPSKPSPQLRKPSKESDSESARDTSSDSSSGYRHDRGAKSVINGSSKQPNFSDASNLSLERMSLGSKPLAGSSSDENGSCSAIGQLVYEYFERETPYNREPLADKIHDLAEQFPDLKTYRSCDLSPSSWVSLAWYPIYRIPVGPTLQDLSACFLTFHSLSTPLKSPTTVNCSKDKDIWSKLSLPIFGLAFNKFKISVWEPEGDSEGQKSNSLWRAADNWIRQLQVNHPDYKFFNSHYTYCR